MGPLPAFSHFWPFLAHSYGSYHQMNLYSFSRGATWWRGSGCISRQLWTWVSEGGRVAEEAETHRNLKTQTTRDSGEGIEPWIHPLLHIPHGTSQGTGLCSRQLMRMNGNDTTQVLSAKQPESPRLPLEISCESTITRDPRGHLSHSIGVWGTGLERGALDAPERRGLERKLNFQTLEAEGTGPDHSPAAGPKRACLESSLLHWDAVPAATDMSLLRKPNEAPSSMTWDQARNALEGNASLSFQCCTI